MKQLPLLLVLAPLLAACQTDSPPAPVVAAGPTFTVERFDCGNRPIPPDAKAAPTKAGSAAASYEQRLGVWGQRCDNKLGSVRDELNAAGQVAK